MTSHTRKESEAECHDRLVPKGTCVTPVVQEELVSQHGHPIARLRMTHGWSLARHKIHRHPRAERFGIAALAEHGAEGFRRPSRDLWLRRNCHRTALTGLCVGWVVGHRIYHDVGGIRSFWKLLRSPTAVTKTTVHGNQRSHRLRVRECGRVESTGAAMIHIFNLANGDSVCDDNNNCFRMQYSISTNGNTHSIYEGGTMVRNA